MKRFIRIDRLAFAALVAAASTALLAPGVHAGPAAPPVPGDIAVSEGNKPFLAGHAVGVQIYGCHAAGDAYRWDLVAPRANLFDDRGKLIATHFAGPTWRGTDGSTVVGQRVASVSVDATAIPWLLLSAASTATGPDGDGLGRTTFIQRIATTGGLPPAPATCSAATTGTTQEVPYTADYVFWKAMGAGAGAHA